MGSGRSRLQGRKGEGLAGLFKDKGHRHKMNTGLRVCYMSQSEKEAKVFRVPEKHSRCFSALIQSEISPVQKQKEALGSRLAKPLSFFRHHGPFIRLIPCPLHPAPPSGSRALAVLLMGVTVAIPFPHVFLFVHSVLSYPDDGISIDLSSVYVQLA